MAVAKPNKVKYKFQKISQEMINKILKDIELGAPNKHAAESHGLSESHFYNLIAQGTVDLECEKPHTLQAKMVVSLRAIEKKEIQECRRRIKKSAYSHKGAEWTLEHAYWRYFSSSVPAKELADEIEQLRHKMKFNQGEMNNEKDNTNQDYKYIP